MTMTPTSAPRVTVNGIETMIGMTGARLDLVKRVQSDTRTVPPVYAPATEEMELMMANPRSTDEIWMVGLTRSPAEPPFAWTKYCSWSACIFAMGCLHCTHSQDASECNTDDGKVRVQELLNLVSGNEHDHWNVEDKVDQPADQSLSCDESTIVNISR